MERARIVSILVVGDRVGNGITFYRSRSGGADDLVARSYVGMSNASILRVADLVRDLVLAGKWSCRPALLWSVGYRAVDGAADGHGTIL